MKLTTGFFLTLIAALVAGIWLGLLPLRVVVVKPIGAVPDGVTAIIWGGRGWVVQTPDALCLRATGKVTLICRAIAMGSITKGSDIVLRLPYWAWLGEVVEDLAREIYLREGAP